jgi:hypothetical protein
LKTLQGHSFQVCAFSLVDLLTARVSEAGRESCHEKLIIGRLAERSPAWHALAIPFARARRVQAAAPPLLNDR